MFDPQLVTTSGRTHIIDRSSKRLPSAFADYQNYQQPLELRDLVKDSINREVQSLSTKSEHIERRELLRSLSYRQSRDGPSPSISSDAPRFSYDGREVSRTYYDSDLKSRGGNKFDSRDRSTRSLDADMRSSFTRDGNKLDEKSQKVRETQGNQKRLPSVVARLMGLEALPDSSTLTETNGGDRLNISRSSEKEGSNTNELIHLSSGKNLRKEPSSPRWRSPDVSMKPLARFPLEPAPWKQNEKARGHKKSGKDSMKDRLLSPSVYSEIDKRLKELEFLESGKDLRALKQIMEAMHGNGLVETLEEGQGSNFSSSSRRTDQLVSSTTKNLSSPMNNESPIVIMKPAKLVKKSGIDGFSRPAKLKGAKYLDYDRKSNSSSVRKVTNQNFNSGKRGGSVVGSVNIKNEKNTKTTLASTSKRQQQLSEDGDGMFGKRILGSVSPRTQQKKLDVEKRSRPPTPPSPVNKSKVVKPNKKQAEPKSSGVRRRTSKNPYLQGSDDQLSESSVASSSSSYYTTEIEDSAQSSDITVHWPQDSEASSSRRSSLTSTEASEPLLKKSNLMLKEEDMAKHGFVPQDHSSPVSVLENINEHEYRSPHPKKHVRKILEAEESICKEGGSSMAQQGSDDSSISNRISRKKLENIDNLVQKLRRVNSNHDEVRVDYIASLCDNANPDHRYVSEILLASGLLLRDFSSNSTDLLQFHPFGHPLNPELYLVLEQTKASTWRNHECVRGKKVQVAADDKLHRKLIFDTVNEILAKKLSFLSCPRPIKLVRMPLNARKLLRELCSEIEGLRKKNPRCSFTEEDDTWKTILSEDVMNRSESWISFDAEISDIVLHVERLVFKDLVKETVLGEIDGLKAKPSRRRIFTE